jgi:hypothetical protein
MQCQLSRSFDNFRFAKATEAASVDVIDLISVARAPGLVIENTMVLCVGLNSTDTPCSPGPGSLNGHAEAGGRKYESRPCGRPLPVASPVYLIYVLCQGAGLTTWQQRPRRLRRSSSPPTQKKSARNRALANAYAQAQEARLQDIGKWEGLIE